MLLDRYNIRDKEKLKDIYMYPKYIQNLQKESDPLEYVITSKDIGIFADDKNPELHALMQRTESFEIRYVF